MAERRAFICKHTTKGVSDCNLRVFLAPGEPHHVPNCPEHGPMAVQANRPYTGQKP
jgi:hypothetical protein